MKHLQTGRPLSILLIWISVILSTYQSAAQIPHVCSTDSCFHAVVIRGILSHSPDTIPLDTNITRFHQPGIFPSGLMFPAIAGTTGHPAISPFKLFYPQQSGYFWHNPFLPYALTTENLEVIRTDVPYSEWFYLTGANREQIFRAIHAQDAGKNFNFGMDLRFINSKGAYLHEHAKASWFAFYAQYRDPFLPLSSDMVFLVNGATVEENGGIADPSYFEDTAKIIREAAPVWLESAQNTHRSIEWTWQTRWYPGSGPGGAPLIPASTPTSDSASVITDQHSTRKLNDHFLLELNIRRSWFLFRDPNPFTEWYQQVRYDTTITYDSVCHNALAARIAYHLNIRNKLHASAGISFESYRFYDTLDPDGAGGGLSPYTVWDFLLLPSLNLRASAKARYDKAFGASHELSAILNWNLTNRLYLNVRAGNWSAFPFRQDLMYASNHYLWEYEMENQQFTQLAPSIGIRGRFPAELSATATRIGKYIYYNSQALPNQYLGTLALYQLLFRFSGEPGHFVIDGRLAWQHANDASILRVPALLGEVTTGYRFRMFSGKINAIAGVVLHGRTTAYLDEYNPVTRVFYHTTKPPVQQYVWADPFMSLVLKKTRFLLKYEHASAWIAGFGQYALPGYPMTDPAFKFAVSWRFMD
jgi:hypothetical protein